MGPTTHNYFFVQKLMDNNEPGIVIHSTNDETGDDYFKFITRASANKFLSPV